jgi:hypothetical protein
MRLFAVFALPSRALSRLRRRSIASRSFSRLAQLREYETRMNNGTDGVVAEFNLAHIRCGCDTVANIVQVSVSACRPSGERFFIPLGPHW